MKFVAHVYQDWSPAPLRSNRGQPCLEYGARNGTRTFEIDLNGPITPMHGLLRPWRVSGLHAGFYGVFGAPTPATSAETPRRRSSCLATHKSEAAFDTWLGILERRAEKSNQQILLNRLDPRPDPFFD